MKLIDVNILVHAHREENQYHEFYNHWLTELLNGRETFFYCEFILSSFIRIVTHPKIYKTPTLLNQAMVFAEQIPNRNNAIGIMPGNRHWTLFDQLCKKANASGNLIPDAYLAALAIEANAEWFTTDFDFKVFEPKLKLTLLYP